MSAADTRVWSTLSFNDAEAAIRFLAAIGFVEHATYRDEQDPHVVMHAEWLWPDGGGVMFGTDRPSGAVHNVGASALYLVCADPDAVFDHAVAAGATVERPMVDQDYGGRGGSVRDAEGNLWSFGDYQPA